MESLVLVLLGFVLLGALLIGLGLGHRSWQVHGEQRTLAAPHASRHLDLSSAIPDVRQETHFQETNPPVLPRRRSQPQPNRRQVAVAGLERVSPPKTSPPKTNKYAVDPMAANRSQQVNPAVKQKRINPPRPINPGFQATQPFKPAQPLPSFRPTRPQPARRTTQTIGQLELRSPQPRNPLAKQAQLRQAQLRQAQLRASRQSNPIDRPSELPPPPPRRPVSKQAHVKPSKVRPVRQSNSIDNLSKLLPPQTRYPVSKQAQVKPAQIRPARRINPIDRPSEFHLPQPKSSAHQQTHTPPSQRLNSVPNQSGPIPPLQINSTMKQTQIRAAWRVNPANDLSTSDSPLDKSN